MFRCGTKGRNRPAQRDERALREGGCMKRSYVIDFKHVGKEDGDIVGGKGANLGK